MEVLVIEDDAITACAIAEAIERWEHHVDQAFKGEEALKKARKHMYDLVLLDIFLPDCRGDDLIQELKRIRPGIGIVTMTGYNSRELELHIRQKGILYYMIKPFKAKVMKEVLDHISKKKKGGRKECNRERIENTYSPYY